MKKRDNYSIEVGVVTVSELVEILQSLPKRYGNWPIYCCGTDAYLCVNEEERNIVIDMEDLFEEFEEFDEAEWSNLLWK